MQAGSSIRLFFASLSLTLLAYAAGARAPSTLPPPEEVQRARAMFKTLIEINSTHSHGSTEAAKVIQQWMLEAGYPASDVVFVAPADRPAKGNLVVRLRGKSADKPILIMGHLDVVEARPEDWSVDPFKFTENGGYFYGRGTIDMKGGIAALAATMVRLKREGYTPPRDIIAAFTADEEAGGDSNGVAFLLKEHRNLIDAPLALNLDGGGGALKNGKPLFFELGTSEKTYVTYTLETTGPGGHGSLPGPDTPIYQLARGLLRLQAHRFPVMLTQTMRSNFQQLAVIDPGEFSEDMKAVAAGATPDPAAAERLSRNTRMNALLRTTCVATLVNGGHAENALPQRAKATIQCRMMPGDSESNVQAALVKALDDPQIRVTLDAPPIVSPESLPTPAITRQVGEVVHSMWPGVPIIPSMATGFSDDRQTRNAGIPSYDVSGIWMDADENRAHGRDERVGVRAFDESVEYTYRLAKAFSKAK
jgi:acetylornithine deacetylase/succinyl-diaminopimelate desuccinylase-like protein